MYDERPCIHCGRNEYAHRAEITLCYKSGRCNLVTDWVYTPKERFEGTTCSECLKGKYMWQLGKERNEAFLVCPECDYVIDCKAVDDVKSPYLIGNTSYT